MISTACAALITLSLLPVPELGGEEREHGTHAFAAGLQQVPGGDIRDLVGELNLAEKPGLDLRQAVLDRDRELFLVAGGEQLLAKPER